MAKWYLTDGKHWAAYRKKDRKGACVVGSKSEAYAYESQELAEAELKRCAGQFYKLSVWQEPAKKKAKKPATVPVQETTGETIRMGSLAEAITGTLREETRQKRRAWTDAERRAVYRKTEGHCYMCGDFVDFDDYEIDHYIPLSHGGANRIENLFCSCHACNALKACMEPDEFFPLVAKIAKHQAAKEAS